MSTNRTSRSKNKIILFCLPVLAVTAIVIVCVFVYQESIPMENQNTSSGANLEKDIPNEISSGPEENSLPVIEEEKEFIFDRPQIGESLSVWVTSKDVVDGILRIRIQIDQNIGSGTCELVIGEYSVSVPISFEPQSASCQGFDVPVGKFAEKTFAVTVRSGDRNGIVTGVIND